MNTLEAVKATMKGFLDKRDADLQTIREGEAEIRSRLDAADEAIRKATEEMDAAAFEAAQEEKARARQLLEMYAERSRQINGMDFLSEGESDGVIDSLLDYETGLTDDFKKTAGALIRKLEKQLLKYIAEITLTENVIREWTSKIHPNYRTRGTTMYTNSEGKKTDRSPFPVPVHRVEFRGCSEAFVISKFLNELKSLRNS